MLITITGKITHKGGDFVVVEAGGLGYQVYLAAAALEKAKVGAKADYWTYEHLREDAHDLYGFQDRQELAMFHKLVAVSGVGPRMALNILALGAITEIERLIERGDIDMLSRVPRVGRKTAQKIVLELKGKLVEAGRGDVEDEVLTALVNLGYSREQAREAVNRVSADEATVEGRLRAALRGLGKK
ncbi:MAG: Holliday junction branch migration protein RuvA [Patescibacteria group bacterium]|jgi:Holliday junction DNA helicase RuvA